MPPPKESDCCTTGIGCTELNDCCYKFGDPDDCTLDKYGLAQPGGICVGDCTFPVGREHIWPWYTVPTDTCVPVIGPFRGYSETTKHSLKLPFQTCYQQYGTMSLCYTESWTDGLGNYQQCFPKNLVGIDRWVPVTPIFPDSHFFSYNCGTACNFTRQCLEQYDVNCDVDDDCCGDSVCLPVSGCGLNSCLPKCCADWCFRNECSSNSVCACIEECHN